MWLDDLHLLFLHMLYVMSIIYFFLMAPNVFMAMRDVTRRDSRRISFDDLALNPGDLVYICVSATLVGGLVFSYPFINVIGRLLRRFNLILAMFTDFRLPEISTRLRMVVHHDPGQGWRVRVSYEGPD
jgi:hypothetical protein